MDEKKDVLDKGGYIFDDDGCGIAAVFDLRDGDKDDCRWRPFLFGVVTLETEVSNDDFCLAIAALISTVVTFLFFRDDDTIVNVDNECRIR